jgi:ureidoglycolate lyase
MTFDAIPLEAAKFSPYGEVFRVARSPQGRTETSWFPEPVDHDRPMNVAYSVRAATPFPLSIRQLERHSLSSQLFLPIDLSRYLVLACCSDANGVPDLSTIGVFMADGSQSVRYGRGVWHAALHLADRPGSYLAVRYCRAMDDDLELFELPAQIEVALPR